MIVLSMTISIPSHLVFELYSPELVGVAASLLVHNRAPLYT